MCVIVAKPSGVALPDEDTLKQCFSRNPHGAGIMYAVNGHVRITKGFMKFDDLMAALKEIKGIHDTKKIPMVIHFRYATHGYVCAENCHPFPITRSYDKMKRKDTLVKVAVAHNGIISLVDTHSDIKKYGVSDTMVFISHIITPLAMTHGGALGFLKDDEIGEIISEASFGKLAYLDGNGVLKCYGQFSELRGVKYSNLSFIQSDYSYGSAFTNFTPKKAYGGSTKPSSDIAYLPVKYRYYGFDAEAGHSK